MTIVISYILLFRKAHTLFRNSKEGDWIYKMLKSGIPFGKLFSRWDYIQTNLSGKRCVKNLRKTLNKMW